MKKFLTMILVAFIASTNVFAQETESGPSIDVAVDVASNYIWRGFDLYESKYAADESDPGAFLTVPSIMPSLTVYTPIEGLWLNVWGGFAATDREYGSDGLGAGLADLDEVDYTVGYDFENAAGAWSMAYIIFSYPSVGGTYEELLFSYTADVVLSPTIGTAVSTSSGTDTEYAFFGVSHSIEAGSISIEPSVTFGYWHFNGAKNSNFSHIDIAVPIGYSVSDSVSIGLTPLAVIRNLTDTSAIPSEVPSIENPGDMATTPSAIFSVTLGVSYSM